MPYFWYNDRYWPLEQASIKPVLSGSVIGSVFLKFPDVPEFPVTGKEVQSIVQYAVRNTISANGVPTEIEPQEHSGNGHTKSKRKFSQESIERMRQARAAYWNDPERGGKRRKKDVSVAQ
jgi:hypothetical protein